MRYYVITDPHSFYSLVRAALEEKGFFTDPEPHMLIICGDLLDRGPEPVEMQDFAVNLLRSGQLIFIRGNHEDLMDAMLDDLEMGNTWLLECHDSVHNHNGTWKSALALAGMTDGQGLSYPALLASRVRQSPFYRYLMDSAVNYYETEHYVFTHGWIPCLTNTGSTKFASYKTFSPNPNWRDADPMDWMNARWYNGMYFACQQGLTLQDKTVVCGHFHTSYGHANIEGNGGENLNADYSPFYADGIIALDGCIVRSGLVNCIVLED
ncbi:MAG: metallophosphoesterase [Clostridia bacterium]|nr:metallophosphoesterase [Clostridia bacterium]